MKLAEGTPVELITVGLKRPMRGVVDADYDGIGDVMVRWDGTTKPRPVDRRTIRPAEPSGSKSDRMPAPQRVRVVPTGKAKLRAVPKPAPPARDDAYLAFVRSHPCLCGCGGGPIEAHHWARRGRGGGAARKPSDYRTVPLAAACHAHLHDQGHLPGLNRAGTIALLLAVQVDLLEEWGPPRGVGRREEGVLTEIEKLSEEIKALPVPDQLRLAAGLLDRQRPDVAHAIVSRVSVELGAALALRDLRRGR